jgi:hypothetical protein
VSDRLIAKYQDPAGKWQAMLTRERYGLHFSVSGQGRDATDAEVDAAFAAYKFGLWIEEHMTEVTSAHRAIGAANPYVRHFVPDAEAERYFRRAAAVE